jgi:hypothetical protein
MTPDLRMPAAHADAVAPRQHDVENDQVEGLLRRFVEPLIAVDRAIDEIPFFPQAIAQRHAQRVFVFYEQNAVHDRSRRLSIPRLRGATPERPLPCGKR